MGDLYFEKAYSKHMAGNRQSARMLYERIIKRNPMHVDATYMLGTLLAESGVLELGLMHLRSAAKLKPDSPMINSNLGHVYLKLGKLDQARDCYLRSLKLNPQDPGILFNLGTVFHQQGKLEQAASYIENSLEIKPDFPTAYILLSNIYRAQNHPDLGAACLIKFLEYVPDSIEVLFELGNILAAHQDYANASIYFKRILEIDPDNGSARHAVAALSGETTATAPRQHVEQIFDDLSGSFEDHLAQLGYRAPEILKEMTIALAAGQVHFDRAIDLGCGTGLSGVQFRPIVKHLTGLDLSQKMLDVAGTKEIYDELSKADLCQYLESSQQQYDLFIATDVFVYIGDLSDTFRTIGAHARPDAYFLFSTEEALEQDFVLRPTGRYAHSRNYIEKLASTHGFAIASSQSINLRMEGQQQIKGGLFALSFNRNG
jgi:predicted TPR repeat methyltransferase